MSEPVYPETPWDDPYYDPAEDRAREDAYIAAMEDEMSRQYFEEVDRG